MCGISIFVLIFKYYNLMNGSIDISINKPNKNSLELLPTYPK